MKPFIHQVNASRVVFGPGSFGHLPREVDLLGSRRALILSTPEQVDLARSAASVLAHRAAAWYAKAAMHVPVEIAREACAEAVRLNVDLVVAVGGGSTTGLAKAIALETGLPILAVPTTYAGSEMTPIWGITEGGLKKTGRDLKVLPRTVIYDPELSVGLPVAVSISSGLNAIAHAAEGLYAHDGNPIADLMAEEGIRALATALPQLATSPTDLASRGDALYGAWLCGSVLGAVSIGLHHKLCHTLGGTFDLPHADVHAVMLPHALAYNTTHAPVAMTRIARALHAPDAARGIYDLVRSLGAPTSLRSIGMPADGLDHAADLAMLDAYPNPRRLERGAIRALLQRAFDGDAPQG